MDDWFTTLAAHWGKGGRTPVSPNALWGGSKKVGEKSLFSIIERGFSVAQQGLVAEVGPSAALEFCFGGGACIGVVEEV
jgi:hypothetical protein